MRVPNDVKKWTIGKNRYSIMEGICFFQKSSIFVA